MVGLLAGWVLLAHAEEPAPAPTSSASAPVDVSAALTPPKKAKWESKGKSLDPFGRGDTKRKQDQFADAAPLLLEALKDQPGCGVCLNSLAKTLIGLKQFDDAAKVGELMAKLFPDHSEGWARVSDAWDAAQKYQEAVDATSKFLEMKKDDTDMWWRRNRLLIQLAKFDDADKLLAQAEGDGVAKEDVTCLKVQVLAATGKPVDGREIWPVCDQGKDLELRHYTEGWLALAEGDKDTAAKRLAMTGSAGGADDFARLVIAYIRLDQGKADMAQNLSSKVLEDDGWALDAQLAEAEALHALGRDPDALKLLSQHLMPDDWKAAQGKFTMQDMLLKPNGEEWPKQVAMRAADLKVAILAASGDGPAAAALAADVKSVYGASDGLDKALDAPIGSTGVGRAQLQTALTGAGEEIQKGFDLAKKKNATLAGAYAIGFTIGADGTVSSAATKSSTITAAPDLEKCTLGEVGKWKLPVSANAQPTQVVWTVSYPL